MANKDQLKAIAIRMEEFRNQINRRLSKDTDYYNCIISTQNYISNRREQFDKDIEYLETIKED